MDLIQTQIRSSKVYLNFVFVKHKESVFILNTKSVMLKKRFGVKRVRKNYSYKIIVIKTHSYIKPVCQPHDCKRMFKLKTNFSTANRQKKILKNKVIFHWCR
jgi:hypothetical protein